MELGVVLTICRSGIFLPSKPSCSIFPRCSSTSGVRSLHTTIISSASLSRNTRINRSTRHCPPTLTKGFGAEIPSSANLEPSPAAMIAYFISRCKINKITEENEHKRCIYYDFIINNNIYQY